MRPNLVFPAKCCCCLIPASHTITIYANPQHVSGQMTPLFREPVYEVPICQECRKKYAPDPTGLYVAGGFIVVGVITWLWGLIVVVPLVLIASGLSLLLRRSLDYQRLHQPAKFDAQDRLVFENSVYQAEFEAANRGAVEGM